MAGVRDLEALLAAMDPELLPGEWVFVGEVPAAATPEVTAVVVVQEPEGASHVVSRLDADRLGLSYDFVAAWIVLTVHSALDAVGLTAAVARELAAAGISCNVVAGLRHDHLFVPEDRAERAVEVLEALRDRHAMRGSQPASGAVPLPTEPGVHLCWIPLGAGAHVVRVSGRIYEALTAARDRRERCDLYHAALVVVTGAGVYSVEVAPVPDDHGARNRGVVASGPVGARWLGRFRVFRYEVRCWPDGEIPDLRWAKGPPQRLADDEHASVGILEALRSVPTPTWGRDDLTAGEMWNSNSVVSWTLERSGVGTDAVSLPPGGRAPGWDAGGEVARRS